MYWINVISELLKIDIAMAERIYNEMYAFDFSEASDAQIKREAKLIHRSFKG